MCQICGFHANTAYDPSRTGMVRRAFEADAKRRITKLRKAVRQTVGVEDAFGLRELAVLRTNAPFKYETSSARAKSFKQWLERQQKKGLLEIRTGTQVSSREVAWSDIYIESAYQKGVAQASGHVRAAGAQVSDQFVQSAFFRPIHADTVGLIYTRTYDDLEGLTSAMANKMSGILAQGMIDGAAPLVVAKSMTDSIKGMGLARARTIARTETMAAHAESTLNTYFEAGIEGVNVQAEIATAGDNKVCPKCQNLEGNIYTIEEARGLLPVHPNCRCAWLPYLPQDLRGRIVG